MKTGFSKTWFHWLQDLSPTIHSDWQPQTNFLVSWHFIIIVAVVCPVKHTVDLTSNQFQPHSAVISATISCDFQPWLAVFFSHNQLWFSATTSYGSQPQSTVIFSHNHFWFSATISDQFQPQSAAIFSNNQLQFWATIICGFQPQSFVIYSHTINLNNSDFQPQLASKWKQITFF